MVKISSKMRIMDTESRNAITIQSNAASTSENLQETASLDFSSHARNTNGGDWQEEIYQKIKSMNEEYFPDLNKMYQRMATKLHQHDRLPQQPKNEQLDKLRFFVVMLEKLTMFLRTNKNEIQPNHEEKSVAVEKQIVNILNSHLPRKPVSSLEQHQRQVSPQFHMHAMQQNQQPQPQIPQIHQDTVWQRQVTPQSHMHAMQQNQQPQPQIPQMHQDTDSSYHARNTNGGDWQEEIYQTIKSMNDKYFPDLNEMYQKMATQLQQHDRLPQQPKNEQLEKLRFFVVMLEKITMFLRTNKNEIQPNHKEKSVAVEKQIVNILNSHRPP